METKEISRANVPGNAPGVMVGSDDSGGDLGEVLHSDVSVAIPGSFGNPPNIMKYIQMYLLFSFVFYFVGPVRWKTQNLTVLIILVLSYQFVFKKGYDWGMKRSNFTFNTDFFLFQPSFWLKNLVLLCTINITINLMLFLRIAIQFGISSILETIVLSFTDPASLYRATRTTTESSKMFGGTLLANVNALLSPMFFPIIPIGFLFFKELLFFKKILFLFAVLTSFVLGMSTGCSEGILRILVFALVIVSLSRSNKNKKQTKGSFFLFRSVIIIAAVIAFLWGYSGIMQNRNMGSYNLPLGLNTINYDNFVFKVFPESIVDLIVYLHIYLTQGYFGMSISLDKPWRPTFFCGFSSWFRGEVEGLLGVDLKIRTFMSEATDFGWEYGTNWHTVYTWFACDVWWIGVLIIMFLMGFVLAKAYKDSYENRNPISIGLLAIMFMFAIYIPANSYIFADSDTFISFFFYLLVLLLFNKKKKQFNTAEVS
jgi:hypothetical protein